jgi:hypothetical protein
MAQSAEGVQLPFAGSLENSKIYRSSISGQIKAISHLPSICCMDVVKAFIPAIVMRFTSPAQPAHPAAKGRAFHVNIRVTGVSKVHDQADCSANCFRSGDA